MKMIERKAWMVGLILCAAGVASAEIAETFETAETGFTLQDAVKNGDIKADCRGTGIIVPTNPEFTSPAGYPMDPYGTNTHARAMNVEGSVWLDNPFEGAMACAQVDFLQEVVETLDNLSTEGIDDVQIALATGTRIPETDDVTLMLYCMPRGQNDVAWVPVGKAPLGTMVRVTMCFDYSNQTCRVSIDGIPLVSTNGFYDSACTSTREKGAWYKLATLGYGQTKVGVDEFEAFGFCEIESVNITEEPMDAFKPFPEKEVVITGPTEEKKRDPTQKSADPDKKSEPKPWEKVTYDDLNRWGIDTETDISTTTLDDSGLTVKEKLELGLDPLDGRGFGILSIAVENPEEYPVEMKPNTIQKIRCLPTTMALTEEAELKKTLVVLGVPKPTNDVVLNYFAKAFGDHADKTPYPETELQATILGSKGDIRYIGLPFEGDAPTRLLMRVRAERPTDEPPSHILTPTEDFLKDMPAAPISENGLSK